MIFLKDLQCVGRNSLNFQKENTIITSLKKYDVGYLFLLTFNFYKVLGTTAINCVI